ncbi:hypothetical protein KFZ76_21305 [Methylovulum psychrotolerans]|uniref:hypothetical protein n=1 Tax=Methylovulum psychrotolerans TaxID=1704499 RepID=UPI001BFF800A|nr:hypothetical protein [Methylovulum psychrotolerans]MBT9100240.1 hypothetical protein [Methylovulum psychrotolerans]
MKLKELLQHPSQFVSNEDGALLFTLPFLIKKGIYMLDLFGFNIETKMLIRLYALPILFLLGSLIVMTFIGEEQESRLLAGVFELLNNVALWLSLILFVLFVITGLYASFLYWRWHDGKSQKICHVCGGMVVEKYGRFGAYSKCLACSTTHSW